MRSRSGLAGARAVPLMHSFGVEDADRVALFRFGRLSLRERRSGVTAHGFKPAPTPSDLRDLADDAVGHDLTAELELLTGCITHAEMDVVAAHTGILQSDARRAKRGFALDILKTLA